MKNTTQYKEPFLSKFSYLLLFIVAALSFALAILLSGIFPAETIKVPIIVFPIATGTISLIGLVIIKTFEKW